MGQRFRRGVRKSHERHSKVPGMGQTSIDCSRAADSRSTVEGDAGGGEGEEPIQISAHRSGLLS